MTSAPSPQAPTNSGQGNYTRRQLVVVIGTSVVRILIGSAIVLGALALVPETPNASARLSIGILAATITVYVVLSHRQIRRVREARYPTLEAMEALVLIAIMFLAVFAGVYVHLSANDPAAFTETLDHFTAFYFALTVLATVGFGDITPVSDPARLVCMIQMGIDLVFIGLLIKVLGGAARQGLQAKGEKDVPANPLEGV